MTCPNENHPDFIKLKEATDKSTAFYYWNMFKGFENIKGYSVDDLINHLKSEKKEDYKTDITEVKLRDKTVNNIKIFIQEQIDNIIKDPAFTKDNIKKVKQLQSMFDAADNVENAKIFVDYYYNSIIGTDKEKGFVYKFDDELKRIESVEDPKERNKILRNLTYYYKYVEGLNDIFAEVEKDLKDIKYLDINNAQAGSTLYKIGKINNAKERIQSITEDVIPELFAETLLPYVSTEAQGDVKTRYESELKLAEDIQNEDKRKAKVKEIEERFKGMLRDKETLKEAFKSFKDQSLQEYWTSPTISSSDPLLSLFAKFVKDKFENMRLSLFQFEKKAGEAYSKFKKWKGSSLIEDPSKFNEDLYELVNRKKLVSKIDEEGKLINELVESKYYSFVEQLNYSKYDNAKVEMLKQYYQLLQEKGNKAANIFRGKWYSENHESLPEEDRKEIINQFKKQLDEEGFKEWYNKAVKIDDFTGEVISYRRELSRPKLSIYSNPKFEKIKANKQLDDYYTFLTDNYNESQKRLPESERLGLRLPNIPKSMGEKLLDKGVINSAKEYYNRTFKKSELDYDIFNSKEQSKEKALPIYYTNSIPFEEVSLDLIESVMKFEKMSLKFDTVYKIKNETKAASIVANNRVVEEVDSRGMKILSRTANKLGINKNKEREGTSNTANWMEDFIDMQIYNRMKEEETLLGVRADKIGDFMTSATSFTSIGIPDALKALANNLQANVQIAIESWSGEFLDRRNLFNGRTFYNRHLYQMAEDFGKPVSESFVNQLIEVFDPLQGEWLDSFGHKVTGTRLLKDFKLGIGYALQNSGEHQAQVSMMFGLMDNTKIDYNGQEITLLEAFEKGEDGIIKLKEGIDPEWNPFTGGKKFKDFVNRTHAINKRLHGVYNKFDKATIERYTAGRLVLFFRKFVVPGMKKRFKSLGVDEELGAVTEGTYRSLVSSIKNQRQDLIKFLILQENNLTERQKNNIKRALIELGYIGSLALLVGILAKYEDDDDSYLYNAFQYEVYRLRSETSFYINPIEFFRVLRTPTVGTTKIEQGIRLANQIGIPYIYDFDKGQFYIMEEYEKKTTSAEKGDNKAFKYFKKMLGMDLSRYNPEAALENLEKAAQVR